ncbi:hypothetical protein [Aurantiacibacter flavus]|uniref:Uncharacterized protein n=1 Tax=Aurantiacibacter flavus TaxID=3145232 RepID=A0ABV0CVN6_9SPHN
MTPEEAARQSWQAIGGETTMPSIEDLRAKSDAFERKIRRRNACEYIAGLIVLLWFGWIALFGPFPWTPTVIPPNLIRLGAGLLMVGTVVALWQLHRRTNPLASPADSGLSSVLDHQRRQLVRQRDALRDIFFWYLLPFAPGLTVMMLAPLALSPEIGSSEWFGVLAKVSIVPLAFIGWWLLSRMGARKLQKQIDAIDALRSE